MRKRFLSVLLVLVMVIGLIPAGTVFAGDSYDLWVGGKQVTTNRLSGSGWSYDASTATLTLSNASITTPLHYEGVNVTRYSLIYSGIPDLTIKLIGTNSLSYDGSRDGTSNKRASIHGIYIEEGNSLTINGYGSLSIDVKAGRNSGAYDICCQYLTVNRADVYLTVSGDRSSQNMCCCLYNESDTDNSLVLNNCMLTMETNYDEWIIYRSVVNYSAPDMMIWGEDDEGNSVILNTRALTGKQRPGYRAYNKLYFMGSTVESYVTVQDDGNGYGEASTDYDPAGTFVTLTAHPNEGYVLKEWLVISGGVTIDDPERTETGFDLGTRDVVVKAVFEPANCSFRFEVDWDDDDNSRGWRPETVIVDVYADGVLMEGQSRTIGTAGDQIYYVTDVPRRNASDGLINYRVRLAEVPAGYLMKVTGNREQGLKITMTAQNTPTYDLRSGSLHFNNRNELEEIYYSLSYADGLGIVFQETRYDEEVQNYVSVFDLNRDGSFDIRICFIDDTIKVLDETDLGTEYTVTGITACSNYSITFLLPSLVYDINVTDDGNGNAQASAYSGNEGDEITLTATAGEGYQFREWVMVSGGITFADPTSPVTTFTIGSDDVSVKAFFDRVYNVTIQDDGHGTASASAVAGPEGTVITLNAVPSEGYQFGQWRVISGDASVTGNSLTIGSGDVTVMAIFDAVPNNGSSQGGNSSSGSGSSQGGSSSSGNGSSSSGSGTTATPVIPTEVPINVSTEPGVAGFVERLYTVALGRPSDPQGKQDWIDAITLRGESGASAARGFLYSPEFLNKECTNEVFVAVLYSTFFDRTPDNLGFTAWVDALNNGAPKEQVIEGFINSTEWANLCLRYGIRGGGTGVPNIEVEPNQQTIDFATRLYTTCLGRDADEAGLMAWARQLANQRDTGTGAARGFFFSSEFTGQNVSNAEYVNRLYRTFMGREADEAGFNAWVAQLDSGVSREEVFEGFAQSPEFTRICASYGIVR